MDSLLANLASIVTILTGVVAVVRYFLSKRQNTSPSQILPPQNSYPQQSLPQPRHISSGRKITAGITATIGIGSIFFASLALVDEIFSSSHGPVDTEAITISIVFMIIGIVILYAGRIK